MEITLIELTNLREIIWFVFNQFLHHSLRLFLRLLIFARLLLYKTVNKPTTASASSSVTILIETEVLDGRIHWKACETYGSQLINGGLRRQTRQIGRSVCGYLNLYQQSNVNRLVKTY